MQGVLGLIPGRGIKIPHALQCGKKKKKTYNNKAVQLQWHPLLMSPFYEAYLPLTSSTVALLVALSVFSVFLIINYSQKRNNLIQTTTHIHQTFIKALLCETGVEW